MRVYLKPTTCTFGRMAVVFYMQLWDRKCAKEKYIISLTKQKDLWQEWSTQIHAAKAEHTHQDSFWYHLETQHHLHKLQTIMY